MVTVAVLIGASLLYGEGTITPAISVLSAVEGLKIIAPGAKDLVIPFTIIILIALFSVQKYGTQKIALISGPVMLIWFLTIAAVGVYNIALFPSVLSAFNPLYAISLLKEHAHHSAFILGGVVLCITGVEAMYADMGHFGRGVIARAWILMVCPALLINYFGQGAALLSGKEIAENHVFYAAAPRWALIPLVVIATSATIIASQALISGAFSLTQQAMALGLFPRLKIIHTNPEIKGQIYLPFINGLLLIGCIWLVIAFKSSGALAAAYGIAVTGTMVITTFSFFVVAHTVWGWKLRFLLPIVIPIFFIDVSFFGANMVKFVDGGYVPVVIGLAVFIIMDTWRFGRAWIGKLYQKRQPGYNLTVEEIIEHKPQYLDMGNSVSLVVMASRPINNKEDTVPPVMAEHYHNWKRLPKHLIFLSIIQTGSPYVAEEERYKIITFSQDGYGTVVSVQGYYGYMEQPNIRKSLLDLKLSHRIKIPNEPKKWLILIGSERIVSKGNGIIEQLRVSLFSRMNRLAKPITDYFGLETDSGVTMETINV